MTDKTPNIPEVVEEVRGMFERYEQALIDKNVDALIRLADRHYLIERGRVVWSGTSPALAAAPEIQHRYLGV